MNNVLNFKPFIKIAGGKTALIPDLLSLLPEDFDKTVKYYSEPFLGGGALFLHLLGSQGHKIKDYKLNEFNRDLLKLWCTILNARDLQFSSFIEDVKSLELGHCPEQYYRVRANLRTINEDIYDRESSFSARFLYLNKACFNGLIRYNLKGEFNSPVGSYKKVKVADEGALNRLRAFLTQGPDYLVTNVSVHNKDFADVVEYAIESDSSKDKNKFFYLDPPYIPLSKTANFTQYSPTGFNEYDHWRLLSSLKLINSSGARFMLSNSDTPLTRHIFKDFNIHQVLCRRNINSKGDKRGKVSELVITNY